MAIRSAILFSLCLAALAGLTAYAQAGATYTIGPPEGWTMQPQTDNNTEWRAPEAVGDAWCRANSNAMPSLADSTQAQINSDHGDVWDAEAWADVLSVPKDNFQIIPGTNASTLVDGHLTQKATLVFADSVFGAKVTARFVSHVLPGRMVNAACFTRTETFDRFMTVFETTISSLEPA